MALDGAQASIEEATALKIQVADLEQRLIAERAAKLQAEIREREAALELHKRDFAGKSSELNALVEAAAKKAGVDLKDGWRPNPIKRVWEQQKER